MFVDFSAITGAGYSGLEEARKVESGITQGKQGPRGGERQGRRLTHPEA